MTADHYSKLRCELEDLKVSAAAVWNYADAAEYYAAGHDVPLAAHSLDRLRDELNATRNALAHVDLVIHAISKAGQK